MLGEINHDLKPQEVHLFLARPDRTIVAKLTDAFNVRHNFKFGGINELSFSLPLQIANVDHQTVRNSHVDLAKVRYLVLVQIGEDSEWYRIEKISDNGAETEEKTYLLYSLGIELADKMISEYEAISITANTALIDALHGTIWSVGQIDPQISAHRRFFEISQRTSLDFVFDIAETFGVVPVFNTANRTVSLVDPDNIGSDKGLHIKYGRYLKSINKEEDATQVATRLRVRGADGLSIETVNPAGTPWVEDFSYFMFPFERNAQGQVIRSSDYMSDGLCIALANYSVLLNNNLNSFSTLLSQKSTLQASLTLRQNEMAALRTALAIAEDNLIIAQTTNQPTAALIDTRDARRADVAAKQVEIDGINAQIATVVSNINALGTLLSMENNFTPQQRQELNQFIIEREWADENYVDPADLYNTARQKLAEMNSPQIVVRIDIVDFTQIVETQHDWGKLNLGDTIYIHHERFNISVKAKIIELDFEYETARVNLVISNITNIGDDDDRIRDLLQRVSRVSTLVDSQKFMWDGIEQTENEVSKLLNETWDAAKRAINSGVNNTVTIDRNGITITSTDNMLRGIRMVNSTIGLSRDGFNNFQTAITADGIIAERLMGKIVIANNLHIENDTGMFRFDQHGATLRDADLTINHRTAPSRVLINAIDGLRIQRNTGTAWENNLSIDVNGNLSLTGNITVIGGNAETTTGAQAKVNSFAATLGSLAFDNAVELAKLGTTVIQGGFIRTGLIDAARIDTGVLNASRVSIGAGTTFATGYNPLEKETPTGAQAKVNVLQNALGTLAYESVVERARLGNTIIQGGFLATDLIQAGTVVAGSVVTNWVYAGNINASQITAGTISANRIDTTNLSAVRIFQSGSPNNFANIGGVWGDLILSFNNSMYFSIVNQVDGTSFRIPSRFFLTADTISTKALGTWDFTGATVSGLTAVARFA